MHGVLSGEECLCLGAFTAWGVLLGALLCGFLSNRFCVTLEQTCTGNGSMLVGINCSVFIC